MSETPRESRPSVTLKIVEQVGNFLRGLIVGGAFLVSGGLWLRSEIYSTDKHTGHIWMAVGLMVLGGIAINPPWADKITAIYIQVAPSWLPIIGGRRNTDLPKQP